MDAIRQQLTTAYTEMDLSTNWCVPAETGQFLSWLAYSFTVSNCLEIGTSIGYSGLWLLAGMGPKGHLHTLDVSPERQQQAMTRFQAANVASQVSLYTGEGRQILPALLATVPSPLDLVFIDAHKADYGWYAETVAPSLRPGGVLVADNTTSHAKSMTAFFDVITQWGWPYADLADLGSGLWVVTKPYDHA